MLLFFDTDDGHRRIIDNFGLELAEEREGMEQAVSLLRDLSHVEVAPDTAHRMSVRVRGADGQAVYVASLDLRVERAG